MNEAGKNAFIFSLDMKEKFVPQNEKRLIYCHTGYGPWFGNNDFIIYDQCNANTNSYANFPITYNREG